MNYTLEDILDLSAIKELLEAFCEITGTAAALIDTEGKIFVATNWARACTQFHRANKESAKICLESDTKILKSLMLEHAPTIYQCNNGLGEAAFPIKINEEHVANMFIGQFLLEPMDEDYFRNQAKKFGYNEEEYIKAMSEVAVIDSQTIMKYANFLKLMTQLVTQIGYDKCSIKELLDENLAQGYALHETRIRQRQIVEALDSMLIGVDTNMNVTFLNKCAIQYISSHTQTNLKDFVGENVYPLFPMFQSLIEKLHKAVQEGAPSAEDTIMFDTIERKEVFNIGLYSFSGAQSGAVIRIDDKTHDYEINQMLQHSQKMAALGQLAGGIAHDFNNMLTGIQGATQLLEKEVGDSPRAKKMLDIIAKASERTADLTAKLLTVSKTKPKFLKRGNINIASVLKDVVEILVRSVRDSITVSFTQNTPSAFVRGDKSTLESAFLNLGINASHAIEGDGEIKFELNKIKIDATRAKAIKVKQGCYIKVNIQDTGKGIPPETVEKIFDPFFTTKKHGTGLGLAMVYSTITDHDGHVSVDSVVGKGTRFSVYLPCSESTPDEKIKRPTVTKAAQGTVLLVDDEEVVRYTGKYLLEEMGYKVITAANGEEALRIFDEKQNEIDIVFSDIVMPLMDGRKLAKLIKDKSPDAKVVLTSAFHNEYEDNTPNNHDAFILKPYSQSDLLEIFEGLKNS